MKMVRRVPKMGVGTCRKQVGTSAEDGDFWGKRVRGDAANRGAVTHAKAAILLAARSGADR